MAKKISALLPELEARGAVYFFALAEREDVNRWEILLSASWSDEDYAASVRVVADALKGRLEPSEIVKLSRVAIVSSDSPQIAEMPESLAGRAAGSDYAIEVELDDAEARKMYVFKATRPENAGLVTAGEPERR